MVYIDTKIAHGGIAIHQGAGKFKAEIPRVLSDETNELTPSMRRILTEVHGEMKELEQRIATMNHEIEDIAARSDIVPITTTARRMGRRVVMPKDDARAAHRICAVNDNGHGLDHDAVDAALTRVAEAIGRHIAREHLRASDAANDNDAGER